MKLHLLGTTGYHPNSQRHTACMMLPEIGLVLDAGTAMFRVRELLCTDTLDIFLTHAHLDHIIGITFLFDVLWAREMKQVRVHAEAEKIAAIREHLFSELIFPVEPPMQWCPLQPQYDIGREGAITHFPLEHPGGAVGYRLDWPHASMAYVTDTTADPQADYVRQIRDVDLLVHECYFPDGWEDRAALTGHSCLTPVAEVAAAARAKRLVLVHVNPLDEATGTFPLETVKHIFADIEVATDQMEIEF